MSITWSDAFSTGIPNIDDQHKQLIRCVNDLNDAMRRGKGREKVNEIVTFLTRYTVQHFRDEEVFMRNLGYPQMAKHVQVHTAFVKQVSDWTQELAKGNPTVSVDICNALSSWLKNHILADDRAYADYAVSKKKAA